MSRIEPISTDLVGGVIASTAGPADNQLTTGTLTASDIENSESYDASSLNLSGSLAGLGGGDNSRGSAGRNDNQEADASRSGGSTGGIALGNGGTLSAGAPSALSASGSQSGSTQSAIATGGITITGGDDDSAALAQTISRDTQGANDGALVQQFDAARREEIAQGFAVTRTLIEQTSTFFANRASDEADLRSQADAAEADEQARRLSTNQLVNRA